MQDIDVPATLERRPAIKTNDGETTEYDLVVGAFGVNSQLSQRLIYGYQPPPTWKTCVIEARVAAEFQREKLGNLIHFFVLKQPEVRYVALTAQNRFTALQSGEIDVLYRNSTQTYLRGVTLGLRQGPVNFYDGQGFVVRRDSAVKDLKGLNGATVCVAQGTTHEVTLGDYGRANGIEWKPLVFDRIDTMYQTFFGGRCDAMTQDASALAGAVATAAPNAADYVVLPQTISKEPLGPFTRNGDEVWTDIIAWLHYGLIEAEELGITAANADEMAKSSNAPAIQRLLGSSGELGSRLGLDNRWMVQAVKAGGNYAEIFERHVGKASPLKLDRGLNATWNNGGLMYAIPFK